MSKLVSDQKGNLYSNILCICSIVTYWIVQIYSVFSLWNKYIIVIGWTKVILSFDCNFVSIGILNVICIMNNICKGNQEITKIFANNQTTDAGGGQYIIELPATGEQT